LLPLALLLAAFGALAAATPAWAQECPQASFLKYGRLIYASERLPASTPVATAGVLGPGEVDEPTADDVCRRRREDVTVVRLDAIDPAVAVGIQGRPGTIFVLGARCGGYRGADRIQCLLEPLELEGESYTASRYAEPPAPGRALATGASLGEVQLAGQPATVVELEGVDPAVAVGVEGRANEAFLARGVCPYERFASNPAYDDLRRCITGPLWLVFDPLGGRSDDTIVGQADRAVAASLQGAEVSLARLGITADIVPRDLSTSTPIGTLAVDDQGAVTLQFTIPDLEPGIYEAVVTCAPCAPDHGGRTQFPAGSIVVFQSGSSSARAVFIAVGVALIILVPAAMFLWLRGRRRRAAAATDGKGRA
jgi:hypothetical protein